jgi:hypothetical protein
MSGRIVSGVHGLPLAVCLLFASCLGWEWQPGVSVEYGEGKGLGMDWQTGGDMFVTETQPWWGIGFTIAYIPPTRLLAEDLLPITGALDRLSPKESGSSTEESLEMTEPEHRWILSWLTTLPLLMQLSILAFVAAIAWINRSNLRRAGSKLLSLLPGRSEKNSAPES